MIHYGHNFGYNSVPGTYDASKFQDFMRFGYQAPSFVYSSMFNQSTYGSYLSPPNINYVYPNFYQANTSPQVPPASAYYNNYQYQTQYFTPGYEKTYNNGVELPIKHQNITNLTEIRPAQSSPSSPEPLKFSHLSRLTALELSNTKKSDIYERSSSSSITLNDQNPQYYADYYNNQTLNDTNYHTDGTDKYIYQELDNNNYAYSNKDEMNYRDYDEYYSTQYEEEKSYEKEYLEEFSSIQEYDTLNRSHDYSIDTTSSYYQDHFKLTNLLLNHEKDVFYDKHQNLANQIIKKNVKNAMSSNDDLSQITLDENEIEEIDAEIEEIIKKNRLEENEEEVYPSTYSNNFLKSTELLHQTDNFNQIESKSNSDFKPINQIISNPDNFEINFEPYNEFGQTYQHMNLNNSINKENFKSNPGIYKLSDLIFS